MHTHTHTHTHTHCMHTHTHTQMHTHTHTHTHMHTHTHAGLLNLTVLSTTPANGILGNVRGDVRDNHAKVKHETGPVDMPQPLALQRTFGVSTVASFALVLFPQDPASFHQHNLTGG